MRFFLSYSAWRGPVCAQPWCLPMRLRRLSRLLDSARGHVGEERKTMEFVIGFVGVLGVAAVVDLLFVLLRGGDER